MARPEENPMPDGARIIARIKRISKIMVWVTGLVGVALLGARIVSGFSAFDNDLPVQHGILPNGAPTTVDSFTRATVFVVGLMPLSLTILGLWNALLLFYGYRRGAIFTAVAGDRVQCIGLAFLFLPLAGGLSQVVVSMVATRNNPPALRSIFFSVNEYEIVLGVAGILLITVGYAISLAARMQDVAVPKT